MGKRLQHATQRKQQQRGRSRGKSIAHIHPLRGTQKRFPQADAIWESSPDGLIACDRSQRITRMNGAACTLLEVGSQTRYQGRDFQQFLTSYIRSDEQPPFVSREQEFTNLARASETGARSLAQALLLHLPSGRKVSVMVHSFPVGEHGRPAEETVLVFHCWPGISHLQRIQEAVVNLLTAIAQMPEHVDRVLPEEVFLLSPPVLFVTQQVVDVIRSVLDCLRVNMLAFGHRTSHVYFVTGSGLASEQEQHWRAIGERFRSLDEMLDDTAIARLRTNQEVLTDHLRTVEYLGKHLPFPAYPHPSSPGSETFLFLPLFLQQQWVGVLVLVKATSAGEYTPEEVALAKAVTKQTMLVMEGIHHLSAQEEHQKRILVQREVRRLVGDFLILATHELRTPLTGIMGNLQLVQRRLKTFIQDQSISLSPQIREPLAQLQQPLAAAAQGAQLQQRMINDLIDDARIQTNTLSFSLKPEDLSALLREVVARQRQTAPEPPIVLDIPPLEQNVPILADARRITYALTTYLTNARAFSPPGRPVEVRLRVVGTLARVSVHNEGAGIAREDLDHVWERFYRAKGRSVQHELDLSCGLPLYLCRVFIERHHGSVGVQSAPGKGATFWLTVPLTPSVST